jgi:Ca2+-binding RTX toxin-like protein
MINTGDTITGGSGTDTLDINKTAILGGLNVDLTNTTDQIISFNGSATSGTVLGFENVDASGFSGSFGAQLVGTSTANTLIGTANGDVINGAAGNDALTGGAGADTMSSASGTNSFTGGAGADAITLGSGVDTVVRNGNATTDGYDTVTSFTVGGGNDTIDFTTQGSLVGGIAVTAFASGTIAAVGATVGFQVFSNNITVADATVGPTEAEIETYLGATDVFQNGATNDSIYVAADNGTDTFVFKIAEGADGTDKKFDANDDVGTQMIRLVGIADATTLLAANLDDFA